MAEEIAFGGVAHEIAIAEFKRCSGRKFDPEPVEALLSLIDGFRRDRSEKGFDVPD